MLQTDPKRIRKKLQSIKEWCATNFRRRKLTELWPTFQLKLQVHINYFGVSYNSCRLPTFIFRRLQIEASFLVEHSFKSSGRPPDAGNLHAG